MNFPTLSIIVPTYNRSDYLQECLESIIAQNYPFLEIVITDDNSTDDTETVCKSYVQKYPYVVYTKNQNYPQGPNGNKNNGLDCATGELITIFDDDDTMVQNALSSMVKKINDGYDIVMGNCSILSTQKDNGCFSGFGVTRSEEIDSQRYLCGEIYGEFQLLFKKKLLRNRRFDIDLYGGESILWIKLFEYAKVFYLHEAVRNYRINENSVTHNTFSKASRVIKNYERAIECFGEQMKIKCPCHLSSIYTWAAFFGKLSSQNLKAIKYIFQSLQLCPQKNTLMMLILLVLPTKFVVLLSKIRMQIKRNWFK
ncbi:MAG TPA: glycosyltransferase family 2 protein [Sulfuricurvum sp.]|nr:glycosyltransferase family 2 protein [Sulfuricurvum sp.]